ncbi:hypothetical protein RhiirC2_781820 [Rhizophagus irregularis]|uniref:Uncharacterized protein n=1 Tax=Rhizophagus irregularis TaxID=588596 RepID=A0A2N1N4G5_9GLOM|nr:hypothetical protein RhiirC2_781820 [Rhizophagus irregularis]
MVCEDSCKDLSDNKSTDSEINNQSFQSMMSISEYNGKREFSEQNTGIWWENAEKFLPPGAKLLSLILYSDATNVDILGKSQLHPIYLSIGNIKNWKRNKKDAKQLLAYLPILKSNNITERKSETFKIAVREYFHKSLELLLDPLLKLNKNGIDLFSNNEMIWFYPRVSAIICDWPEAATYCLTYKLPMSKHPWAQCGKTLVDEVDHRLATIPRFLSLKIFTNGIQSITRLTANEYRNLIKVMVFVVDNLFVNNEDDENFVKNEDLAKFYEAWNEMYAISRYKNFKESDLVKFRVHLAKDCLNVDEETSREYIQKILQLYNDDDTEDNKCFRIEQLNITDFWDVDQNSVEPLSKQKQEAIDQCLLKAFVCCSTPFAVVENPFFVDLIRKLQPGYKLPSHEKLAGIMLSHAVVRIEDQVNSILGKATNLTLGLDG